LILFNRPYIINKLLRGKPRSISGEQVYSQTG
jgi:hypothetical protein